MATFHIKTVLFSTGERFPMLINSETGIPDYWITIYSMTQLRSKGLSVNTIEQNLQHLKLLTYFLNNNYNEEINLEKRLEEGKLLDLPEIESLCNTCKIAFRDLTKEETSISSNKNININSLEKFRSNNMSKIITTVDTNTTAHRIRAIKDYLVWLPKIFLSKKSDFGLKTLALNDSIKLVESALTARIPKHNSPSPLQGKKGLSEEEAKLLLSIVAKDSQMNPWKSIFAKTRNELIILWLYQFGLRRGELLNLKISDIDFQAETFVVLRRADDIDDPRTNQPLVKTRERKLSIPKKILDLTYKYVLGIRGTLPEAVYHPYLFVADKSGEPMSIAALNKVFFKLKEANPNLPRDLSPHTLRHTWNDRFSALMDKENIPAEKEKKMRSYSMGWSDTSNSASTYTRRHIQNKANEIILEMGDNLIINKKDE